MSFILIAYFVAIIIFCLTGPILSFSLNKKFDLKYVMFLHYHVLTTSIFGFVVFFMFSILSVTFFSTLNNKILLIFHLFQLLQLALVFLIAFLFFNFMAELAGAKIPARFINALTAYTILISIALILGYIHYFSTGNSHIYGKLITIGVMLVIFLIKMGAIRYAYLNSLQLKNCHRERLIFRVSIIYLIGYMLYYSMSLLHGVFPVFTLMLPFIWFSINIPPLILIRKYLDKYQLTTVATGNVATHLHRFCEKFGVTKREREIIEFILKGCSNNEIEKQLFISGKTVKNHVYNIYRKAGVNSRSQLIKTILGI